MTIKSKTDKEKESSPPRREQIERGDNESNTAEEVEPPAVDNVLEAKSGETISLKDIVQIAPSSPSIMERGELGEERAPDFTTLSTPIEVFFSDLKELVMIQERKDMMGECCGGPTKFVYWATKYDRPSRPKDGGDDDEDEGASNDEASPYVLRAEDTSKGFCRYCCPRDHGYSLNLRMEPSNDIEVEGLPVDILSIHRKNHVYCCCGPPSRVEISRPALEHEQDSVVLLGSVEQDCCFGSLRVYEKDHQEQPLYVLDVPSCCCGICQDCGSNTHGSGKPDYRIYSFKTKNQGGRNRTHFADDDFVGEVFQITHGPATWLHLRPIQVGVVFPDHSSPNQKAILLGGAQLLNSMFFAGIDPVTYPTG